MTRVILLGVGTGLPDADRGYTSLVCDHATHPLLIDVGGSSYQQLLKADVDPQTLCGIILTHSHADHINGLPGLLFSMALAGRKEPLAIYGLGSTLTLTKQILEAFALGDFVVPVHWQPVTAGSQIFIEPGWDIHTALNVHSCPCLALRIEHRAGDLTLAYSGDTEPCQSVVDLARGADILIHEATTPKPFPGHSTPRQAGEVAQQAGVRRLVLVHFSPKWTMPKGQALNEIAESGFCGIAEIGYELQILQKVYEPIT